MTATERRPLIDYLPAVLREGDARTNGFLGRFLAAFEAVFHGVEEEIDALPHLFSLAPTPSLASDAFAPDPNAPPGTERFTGSLQLRLDSATRICPGDVVQIEDVTRPVVALTVQPTYRPRVEFVRARSARGADPPPPPPVRPGALSGVIPRVLEISSLPAPLAGTPAPLRFSHDKGAPVELVGSPGAVGTLDVMQPALGPARQLITLAGGERLGAVIGDVMRVGEGDDEQYAQVVELVDVQLDATRTAPGFAVTPALTGAPTPGLTVALMQRPVATTPAPALRNAVRTGPEFVIETPTRASDLVLELDSLTGLAIGDMLYLDDRDPAIREVVRIAALSENDTTPPARLGVRLESRLERDHPAGSTVFRVVPAAPVTHLAEASVRGQADLTLVQAADIGLTTGDLLLLDFGVAREVARIASVAGPSVTTTSGTAFAHGAAVPAVALRVESGGTGFLRWLAGAIGLELRPDRGERWNRELLRDAGSIWPWRGTRRGVEEFVASYVRGEASVKVVDPSNPMQLGVHCTVGDDTVLCGHPSYFWVELRTEHRNSRMYHPTGLLELTRAARDALRREAPAHLTYDLLVRASSMRLGDMPDRQIGARLGDTTLLWSEPLIVPASIEGSSH